MARSERRAGEKKHWEKKKKKKKEQGETPLGRGARRNTTGGRKNGQIGKESRGKKEALGEAKREEEEEEEEEEARRNATGGRKKWPNRKETPLGVGKNGQIRKESRGKKKHREKKKKKKKEPQQFAVLKQLHIGAKRSKEKH
ncbi:hypothetical protein ACFX2J_000443 [Malus domestica]|nr:cilia- and flagella-associated protein 251-like [Malus domestica]